LTGSAVLALTVLSEMAKLDPPSISIAAPIGALLPESVLWVTVPQTGDVAGQYRAASSDATHLALCEGLLGDGSLCYQCGNVFDGQD
jgi:hypothetical protein